MPPVSPVPLLLLQAVLIISLPALNWRKVSQSALYRRKVKVYGAKRQVIIYRSSLNLGLWLERSRFLSKSTWKRSGCKDSIRKGREELQAPLSLFYWKTSFVFSNSLRKMFLSFCSLCSRSRRANSSSKRFCSTVKLVGVTTLTMTCWSPRALQCTTGTPIPLRRNERLLCVPAGILSNVVFPSTIGISTSSPSAACAKL